MTLTRTLPPPSPLHFFLSLLYPRPPFSLMHFFLICFLLFLFSLLSFPLHCPPLPSSFNPLPILLLRHLPSNPLHLLFLVTIVLFFLVLSFFFSPLLFYSSNPSSPSLPLLILFLTLSSACFSFSC